MRHLITPLIICAALCGVACNPGATTENTSAPSNSTRATSTTTNAPATTATPTSGVPPISSAHGGDTAAPTAPAAANEKPEGVDTAALDEKNIAYIHLQKLGTPAEGRAAAKSGDFETMLRMYDKHIKTPEAAAALDDLVSLIKSGKRVAPLCYEREACECHRSHIAGLVKKRVRGIKVEDLVPPLF